MGDLPPTARLAAFALGLLVAFGAAFGLGRTVGPIDADDPAPVPTTQPVTHRGGH